MCFAFYFTNFILLLLKFMGLTILSFFNHEVIMLSMSYLACFDFVASVMDFFPVF